MHCVIVYLLHIYSPTDNGIYEDDRNHWLGSWFGITSFYRHIVNRQAHFQLMLAIISSSIDSVYARLIYFKLKTKDCIQVYTLWIIIWLRLVKLWPFLSFVSCLALPTTAELTTEMNENENTCDRLPDLHLCSRNLTRCMLLDSSGSARKMKVHIHLTTPKQRTFHVSLSGMGLNCSPIRGVVMSTISSNGKSIRCKALVGSHEDALDICRYECKCPDVCSNVVVYISDTLGVSLCEINS